MKCIGPQGVRLLIDNDVYIIGCIASVTNRKQVYPDNLNPSQVKQLNSMVNMLQAAVMGLGMLKQVTSRIPAEMVEAKVTPEWLIRRGREKFPDIIEVIDQSGEKGLMWLIKQAREIVNFCTNRLVWSNEHNRLVEITD